MTRDASNRARMTSRWRCVVATCAAVLVALAVPSVSADTAPGTQCNTRQFETLTLNVGKAPKSIPAGRTLAVPVQVVRAAGTAAERGAEGVKVRVTLVGKGWGVFGELVSDAQGRTVTRLAVPRKARGAVRLDVEGFRPLMSVPCLALEEHGRLMVPWGVAS